MGGANVGRDHHIVNGQVESEAITTVGIEGLELGEG